MKFHIVSDLHLEFGPVQLPKTDADVLVLAGDITVANYFTKSQASPYYQDTLVMDAFFEWAKANYKHVIYVLGNHEHYQGNVQKSLGVLINRYPWVKFLEKEVIEIDGVRIFGATLWTDMNAANPHTCFTVESGMNDFRIIKNGIRKLRAMDTVQVFRDTMHALEKAKPDVVITHHAPSEFSVAAIYKTDKMSPAYFSNLEHFILDSEIKLWVHGHMHNSNDYMIGDTRIVCNPRGYVGHELNKRFDPGKVIEL